MGMYHGYHSGSVPILSLCVPITFFFCPIQKKNKKDSKARSETQKKTKTKTKQKKKPKKKGKER